MRWRQGEKQPMNVYLQKGPQPDARPWPDGDDQLTMFTRAEHARLACDAVNTVQRLADMWRVVRTGAAFPELVAAMRRDVPGFVDALDDMVRLQFSITCPTCGRTSYNGNDIANAYCGECGYHDGSLRK
jgi:ribosomal protein S27AE